MPPIIRKTLIWIAGIALFLVLLNIGVSYWISKKLPSIIQSEKDFPYNISYEDLDINLLSGSFTVHNVFLAPKDTTSTALKQGAFGNIKTIEVHRFNLWALLRDNRIKVKRIIISNPDIVLYEKDKKYNVQDDVVKPFKNTVNTGSLEILNGKFQLLDTLHKPVASAGNINLEIDNIKLDSAIVQQNIPVRYTDYKFKCDSLFYRVDDVYDMTAKNVTSSDTSVTVNDFRLIPKYSRVQYTRSLPKEKDLFTLKIKKLELPDVEWGYINDTLFIHSKEVIINTMAANVYRSKEPADDPSRKKLYSEMLRNLNFDLKVDKLLVKNSDIEYEEQLTFDRPAAKVSFSRFYATVTNLYSMINKEKVPTTVSDVQCLFMKKAPMKITWTFDVPDVSDSFTIKGHLQNIDSEDLNQLSMPLMNIKSDADIKDVKFTMNGNRNFATGSFAINYDNMKVGIYKKNGKEKNKFMSAVGNLIVKNDSSEGLKQTDVKVERLNDKSVFNFMWRFLQEGLKQTLLPKVVSAILPKSGK